VPKPVSRASTGSVVADQNPVSSPEPQRISTDHAIVAPTVEDGGASSQIEKSDPKPTSPATKGRPTLWTGLFKAPTSTATTSTNGEQNDSSATVSNSNFSKANTESLVDALRAFNANTSDAKLAFIMPRGLVNTGNMCYMNSVSVL
jgi:ubiquitin carboxyl-terminal hydrolase 10